MQNEILIQEGEYQDADYSTISVDDDIGDKGQSPIVGKLLQQSVGTGMQQRTRSRKKKPTHYTLLEQGIKISMKSWIRSLLQSVENDCSKRT